ncbi:hypothetical protein SAMN04487950_0698 [Halogranum rubrum]|uniref:Dolichyl-phosphate-mannose-protein mannosyltransferase n=1 Tax=Halogranum rubrum TaxID=553466 RepID=A0A1I4BQJ9_9EURY|nr:hypothetical protein [Halogranum rubrum]SFK70813.1 hypothetical protein SAMN04487950_0698 [Halogranum rubrum]
MATTTKTRTLTHTNKETNTTSSRAVRLGLTAGYLSLAVGVLAARAVPATSYEPSPYTATPILFWVGLVVAVTLGLASSAVGSRLGRYGGLGLAGLATVAFLALPFIRSYYFYGSGDALTHLGWAQGMLEPGFGFFDLIYPGGHSLSLYLSQMMGVPVRHGLMYAMLAVSVVTLLFVPLSVWVVLRDKRVLAFAAVTAMLMLPMNNISTHPGFHTYTLGTLYFPLVLYMTFKHITRGADDETLPSWLSAVSLLSPIPLAAMVFYHPQVAIDVVILLATVLTVGYIYRRRASGDLDSAQFRHRLLVGQVVVITAIFVYWTLRYEKTYSFAENTTNSLLSFLETGEGVGSITQDRANSGQQLGENVLLELFLKLFLVKVAYIGVATALVAAKLFGRVNNKSESDSGMVITYLGFSGLTLGPFFAVQYLGNVSSYFFRHLGFAMVLVGVLAAVGLFYFARHVSPHVGQRGRALFTVFGVLVLCLSLVAYYPSPYVYLPSSHTPETQFVGYQTTFDTLPEETPLAKVRIGPSRFSDALGAEVPGRLLWGVPGPQMDSLGNITEFRENNGTDVPAYYLVVSERDRGREVDGFHGIRYQNDDFERVQTATDSRISRVQTNGDYEVYYIDQRGLPLEATPDVTG